MDVIGQPLAEVEHRFGELHIKYNITVAQPISRGFSVDNSLLYVIRQHVNADGVYHLVAAGKMGKEVLY